MSTTSREVIARAAGPAPVWNGLSGESMLSCSFWLRPAGVWATGGVAIAPGSPRVDFEPPRGAVAALPGPEDVVDEAVVKVEDRVQGGGVVLPHVTVGAREARAHVVARDVDSPDRHMHV